MPLINVHDFQKAAKTALPKEIFDYIESGADDEISKNESTLAFSRIRLFPRVLVNVSQISLETEFLGQHLNLPILIAPTAFHGLVHADAEIATAKAAESVGTTMVVSTMANTPLEQIKEHVTNAWFQLYPYKDRKITEDLVTRAERAGYKAIVLTSDCPVMGNRENDRRNCFKLPDSCIAANFTQNLENISYNTGDSTVACYTNNNFDNTFTWKDIAWLRSLTSLPIILKGILHPADAQLAIDFNLDGIVVSNHGGRQVDTTPPPIEALPAIAKVIQGKMPIFIDGGIRRGTDIIKCLSLGATAVLIGRPILWGLSANGQQGVEEIFSILRKELILNMALCGYPTIQSIQASKALPLCQPMYQFEHSRL